MVMNASILVELCQSAYSKSPDISDDLGVAQAILHNTDRALVVAFRGTEPTQINDDLADLELGPLTVPGLGLVHQGFWAAASRIAPIVADRAGDLPLYLTGHSLGGAIAIALAAYRRLNDTPTQGVITFGAPRVGIGVSLKHALATTPLTLYRHRADIVPLLPPNVSPLLDWQHPVSLTHLGEAGLVPSIEDHAIASYRAALTL